MSDWSVVPAGLLALALAASCLRKARRAPASVELRERLGITPRLWSGIGLLEGAAVAGLLIGPLRPGVGGAAAAGAALLMAGAITAHLRVGLSGRSLLPPAVLLAVAAAAVLGFTTSS
jgi:hypothetical protein